MNASWKNPSHKSGILALVGLAALAWIKLAIRFHAAQTPELGFPLGYGLVFTPIMDEF